VPDFGQDHLSVHPETLDVDWLKHVGHLDALPDLVEPDRLPPVTAPIVEDMVEIDHPRITCVEAYRSAGWIGATRGLWLRREAMRRLSTVADGLDTGWGLHVFDAWRPLVLQAELYETAYRDSSLPPGFVSEPREDPSTPPPHLTGGTVDLTLSFEGVPLSLGTAFDDFSPAARTNYFELNAGPVRALRRRLYWSMRAAGFIVLDCEWWHFEFGTRRWGHLVNRSPIYGPAASPHSSSECS
jgi:D-alanyl-D-alanine dipeptidase